ncbi:MAG: ATP-binding protein [Candidatus Binataceae bacterium]
MAVNGFALRIDESSRTGEARRRAAMLARQLGFTGSDCGAAGIIAAEAATNLLRHAGGGEMIAQPIALSPGVPALELIALDRGPGMRDVSRCMTDGFSTAGTLGGGLGAIKRLSTFFDIYSAEGGGTALAACIAPNFAERPNRESPRGRALCFGGVSAPKPGEEFCGDSWTVRTFNHACQALIVDGLGHGFEANKAARAALETFNLSFGSPAMIIKEIHESLRPTRGAVGAVAEIDYIHAKVRFAGIGNIGAVIMSNQGNKRMVSHYGTLGHHLAKISEFAYDWPRDGCMVLHSDGLAARWNLDGYPGLARHAPAITAAVLYRDFSRGNDDAAVVVIRSNTP